MRNVFVLTKREQRIVVVIVTLLVLFAFAKHWWEDATQLTSAKLKTAPIAASPTPQNVQSPKEPGD